MGDVIDLNEKRNEKEYMFVNTELLDKLKISDCNRTIMRITGDYIMTLYSNQLGEPLVTIDMNTGVVAIHKKDSINDAALQFWAAIGMICPMRKE